MITVITVNYNTPEYLERLLESFRRFYDIPVLVIDGSNKENYEKIKNFDKRFSISLMHFPYNIHHGPGLLLASKQVKTDRFLFLDSDMIIHSGEWLEMMDKELKKESYGIGDIQKEYYMTVVSDSQPRVTMQMIRTNRGRRLTPRQSTVKVWVDYLHPVCALINKNVYLKYPGPIKGGAPLIEAMKGLHLKHQNHLLQRAQWLTDDLHHHLCKYVQHNDNHAGMGTVTKTGGYHL